MSESVSKHIVRQWSSYGIEVLSSGDDSCTLVLPPRVEDIGDLCEDLWDSFGATVDIDTTREVYEPLSGTEEKKNDRRTRSITSYPFFWS